VALPAENSKIALQKLRFTTTATAFALLRTQHSSVLLQDRDIYLLENIFADADPSVAASLMERVIGGVLSAKTRVVVSSFAPCVAAAQRVITLEGGQAIHGAGAEAPRHGLASAADVGRTRPEDERWQVRQPSAAQPALRSSCRIFRVPSWRSGPVTEHVLQCKLATA